MAYDLFEASFLDSKGKTHTSRGNFTSDTDAKAYFNGLASKSRAQWARLRKLGNVTVPILDGNGVPINTNYKKTPTAGMTVQAHGICTFVGPVARDVIKVVIPAVIASYLADGSGETHTSPLQSGNLAKLRSENNGSATSFRKGRYTEAKRRIR